MNDITTLDNVYWIGGGSGAGKSTVATALSERYGLKLYSTDDRMREHSSRSSPKQCPRLHDFMEMNMDERWLTRSPKEMLDTFHWFLGEGFNFILEDLRSFPAHEKVVAEGFRLLPHLVRPMMADKRCGVWLIPTPEFRRFAFENRGTLWDIAGKTSDPKVALDNLLERDRFFTNRLSNDVAGLDMCTIRVDGTSDEQLLVTSLATKFGFVE